MVGPAVVVAITNRSRTRTHLSFEDADQEPGGFSLLKKIWARLVHCPRGKHRRSRKLVRKVGEQHLSRCHNCGIPMVRIAKRNWVVDDRRK